jgi:hypothetical protein
VNQTIQLLLSLVEAVYAIVGSFATACLCLLLIYSLFTYNRELKAKLRGKKR